MNPGDLIDIWVVEKQLGSGGMGSVYRCHNKAATRILAAVKVLDSQLRKVKGAEERFIREAEILFQLDHPNIVKVRNVRTDTDPPYLEMEFVQGESLDSRLERGAIPIDEAIDFMHQMTDALRYLHAKQIRHRDIKPANVLINESGRLKLVDFGLAMEADASRLTQTGMAFGTVSYAPPEWVTPEKLDPVKWDLYATGVLFWEMLTGQVAFPVSGAGSARQQALQVILAKQNHPPLDPGPAFHAPLRELVQWMTRANPAERASDAQEVLDRVKRLERTLAGPHGCTPLPIQAARYGTLQPTSERTWIEDGSRTGPGAAPRTDLPAEGGGSLAMSAGSMSGEVAVALPASSVDRQPQLVANVPAPDTTFVGHKPAAINNAQANTASRSGPLETLRPSPLEVIDDVPAVRSKWPLIAAGAFLALGAAALVAFMAVGGLALMLSGTPSTRDVELVVSGLPAGTEVAIRIDDHPPAASDGWIHRFTGLEPGTREVRAAVGPGCGACLGGTCPVWCGEQPSTIEIVAGAGTQTLSVALEPPTPRQVRLTAPKVADGENVTFAVGAHKVTPVDAHSAITELAPGTYTAVASARGQTWTGELVVAWGTGELPFEVPLIVEPVSTAAVATTPEPRIEPKPEPKPVKVEEKPIEPASTSASKTAGRLVTAREFAKWLADHPEWHQDGASASKIGDPKHLNGWSGTSPPTGKEKGPAVAVNWGAASAFCTSRGGLAAMDAEPKTWPDSNGIWYEFRRNGSAIGLLGSDGMPIPGTGTTDFTGFRCAR